MQVSLNIEDSYYTKFLELIQKIPAGSIKIVSSENSLDEDVVSYMKTEQFNKDKLHYNKVIEDIENRTVELVPFEDGLDELDDFIDNVK